MSKKKRVVSSPRKIYPKTNISKTYYKHLVDNIEHDPLVRHSTLTVACMIAAISVLLGTLIWFAKANPGNLIQSKGTITSISTGKVDDIGTIGTFVLFDFKTKDNQQISARQPANDGLEYKVGQEINVGYHPRNPNYVRNLNDNTPPQISFFLWFAPFVLMIWFIFVAGIRYTNRQRLIWDAAEAADSDD